MFSSLFTKIYSLLTHSIPNHVIHGQVFFIHVTKDIYVRTVLKVEKLSGIIACQSVFEN